MHYRIETPSVVDAAAMTEELSRVLRYAGPLTHTLVAVGPPYVATRQIAHIVTVADEAVAMLEQRVWPCLFGPHRRLIEVRGIAERREWKQQALLIPKKQAQSLDVTVLEGVASARLRVQYNARGTVGLLNADRRAAPLAAAIQSFGWWLCWLPMPMPLSLLTTLLAVLPVGRRPQTLHIGPVVASPDAPAAGMDNAKPGIDDAVGEYNSQAEIEAAPALTGLTHYPQTPLKLNEADDTTLAAWLDGVFQPTQQEQPLNEAEALPLHASAAPAATEVSDEVLQPTEQEQPLNEAEALPVHSHASAVPVSTEVSIKGNGGAA